MKMNKIGLANINIDMDVALNQQYFGLPTDAEEGLMVRKTFRIRRELDGLIDKLVQDPHTYYRSSQDFFHHATLCLVDALCRLDAYKGSLLAAEKEYEAGIRLQAYEAERLRELQGTVHRFDEGLDLARQEGDWESILHYLEMFEEWVRKAPTVGMRSRILRAVVDSQALQRAVLAFHSWSETSPRTVEPVRELAERWYRRLEDVMTHGF